MIDKLHVKQSKNTQLENSEVKIKMPSFKSRSMEHHRKIDFVIRLFFKPNVELKMDTEIFKKKSQKRSKSFIADL